VSDASEEGFLGVGGAAIHYRFVPSGTQNALRLPPLVFLHEGLGSVALWRTFPDDVWAALGNPTMLVYSRHGYGRSSVVTQPRSTQYMHHEAQVILPELLLHFGVEDPVIIGHSDGASIALIHAGSGCGVRGLALIAPHVFVEECSVNGARAAKATFEQGGLRERMVRHHNDADATFRGWNNVWLSEGFRNWNIESFVRNVTAPTLVVQGDADQYGTVAQVQSIAANLIGPGHTVVLPGVGHAPHLESPDETRAAVVDFFKSLYA
jgi:pimeloyl-ACP methyl ester carboxylesterase